MKALKTKTNGYELNLTFQRELKTEIILDSSSETVWQILTDFSNYNHWSDFILAIHGTTKEGEHLSVTLALEEKSRDTFTPVVIKSVPRKEFRWRGKLLTRFLFSGEHYLILQELDEKRTKLIHGELFSGLLIPFLWKTLRPKVTIAFTLFNEALKRRADSKSTKIFVHGALDENK